MRKSIVSFLCLLVAFRGCLQIIRPSQNALSAPLEVSMQVLYEGCDLPEGEAIHEPADLYIMPSLETTAAAHAGDTVKIDVYGDGRKLFSGEAVWHDEVNPSKNARPGQAIPMFIMPAGFGYPVGKWANVPEGKHVLLARAYDFHGLSAFSRALHFTVLPPLPSRPVSGTHVLTGTPPPVLNPKLVRLMRRPPRVAYEVMGTVTAYAPGKWSYEVAAAELRSQAAQMGANWVIVDEVPYVAPISKTNNVFIEPESGLSGRAV